MRYTPARQKSLTKRREPNAKEKSWRNETQIISSLASHQIGKFRVDNHARPVRIRPFFWFWKGNKKVENQED